MNAHTEIHQQPDVQAAILILQTEHARQMSLGEEARAARKAATMDDYRHHIRACHARALLYYREMMAHEPGSRRFIEYRDLHDEQYAKACDAIRHAKIERDSRI